MRTYILVSAFILALLAGSGCTPVQTVPLAAQVGSTIMVAIGSPDNPSKANIDLQYVPNAGPSAGNPITIPDSAIRAIFNIYPDKKSFAWLYSAAGLIENNAGHGPWTTVLVVDLPNDGSLYAGTGNLRVNTTANYIAPIPSPNGVNIAMEILPGVGLSSTFDYYGIGQVVLTSSLSDLEPMKRLDFRPTYTGKDDTHTYGAVEIKIGIDKSGISEDDFNIVVDDKIGTTQTRNVSVTWNAQRFETTVYFISPTGELQYSDVDFSIISQDLQNQFETGAQDVDTDVSISSTWYDVNGAVDTSGPPVNIVNLTGT